MYSYIDILSEIVFIFGFGVESVSWVSTYFPFRTFVIAELVMDVVVRAFGSLFPETVNDSHFFGDELFGFCISGGCSKGEVRCCWFFTFSHIAKS